MAELASLDDDKQQQKNGQKKRSDTASPSLGTEWARAETALSSCRPTLSRLQDGTPTLGQIQTHS